MAKDYLELSELLARVKEGVEDAFPDRYWVKAEIGSWSPRANGHCYLNLTESDQGKPVADIRAMIWKWQFPQLKAFFEQETGQQLQSGITVLVRVQVHFSEMFGISLFIDDIDPAFTVGEQALAKKKAIEKLTAGAIWRCSRNWCSRGCHIVWPSLLPRQRRDMAISSGICWRTKRDTPSSWTSLRP